MVPKTYRLVEQEWKEWTKRNTGKGLKEIEEIMARLEKGKKHIILTKNPSKMKGSLLNTFSDAAIASPQ